MVRHTVATLLLLTATARAGSLILFDTATYPYAKCLDGSPSGYYVRPSTNPSTANRFLIVLEGGGMCTGRADCTARAATDLGSSKNWSASFDWNSTSLTTTDPRNYFRAWNTIWVKYCDGSLWTGRRASATADPATFGLWFSGHRTVDALLDHLAATLGLNASTAPAAPPQNKTFLAFAGGSAGGLGVFANVDHVARRLPHATVVGVPIGGYVPAIAWFAGDAHHAPDNDVRDAAFAHHARQDFAGHFVAYYL